MEDTKVLISESTMEVLKTELGEEVEELSEEELLKKVQESSKVLNIRGRVLPSTLDDMKLAAELEDGSIVKGESSIPETGKKIKRLFTEPANCKALPEVIKAVREAVLII